MLYEVITGVKRARHTGRGSKPAHTNRWRSYRQGLAVASEGHARLTQAHREVLHLVDHLAVDRQVTVGLQQVLRIIDRSGHRLDRHPLVARDDLAPVVPAVPLTESDRLEHAVGTAIPAPDRQQLEQLQERLEPQRSGADRVLVEVRLEEPLLV